MTKPNRHFAVMSPVYEDNYYYYEPPEPVVDWVTVDAPNKRLAKAAGLKKMRQEYPHGYWSGGDNPFVGLTVMEICPHDMDLNEANAGWCQECGGPGPCNGSVANDIFGEILCDLLDGHPGEHEAL